ncbi:MAG: hypothetical protein WBQ14_03940 [Gaiellaceae bacterium]
MSGTIKPGMRRRLLTLAALAIALLAAANANAYWTSFGSGSGSSQAGTLDAPTIGNATPGAGTVALSWSAVTPPGLGTVSYYVTRGGGNPGGNCPTSANPPTSYSTGTTCTDSGLAAGTYTYTVTAVWRTWTATSSPATQVNVASGAATKLSFTRSPGNTAAGTAFASQPQVTVQDQYGNTVTTDSSNVTIAVTGGTATVACTANPKAAASGVATFAGCAITKAGTYTLTATDGLLTSAVSGSFAISAAAASKLSFTQAPGNTAAGTAFASQPQVTVQDQYGNTVTTDSSNVTIAVTGGTASVTCTANPKAAASGVATFAGCAITKAGTYTLTATDGSLSPAVSSPSFTITAATAVGYSLTDTSGNPLGSQTAGTAFSVRLTALDTYGNTATSYADAKTIAWSGPGSSPNNNAPSYPASATAVTFTGGVGTATGIILYKAETPTLQAQDSNATTIKGTASFAVAPRAINSFSLAAATITPSAGQPDNLTITALDQYGNTATAYNASPNLTFSGGTGTRTVTNSSGTAVSFGAATALSFASGVASVTGSNNGAMTLYAVQTANIGATGGGYTTNTISVTVHPGPIASFTIPNPGTRTVGSAFNLAISAFDAYGNASDFSGTRCLTITGASASPNNVSPLYPAQGSCDPDQSEVTFTNGSASPSITLYNAISTTLTVTDVTTGTSRAVGPFNVNAGQRGGYNIVPAATTMTAGATNYLKIYDSDAYGNHVAGSTGNRTLYFSGARGIGAYQPTVIRYGTPTTAINFGDATTIRFNNGVATVASGRNGVMTLYKAGTAYIVVSDGTYSNGSGVEITVDPAAMSNIALSAAKVVVRPSAPDQLTIRAVDTYGNSALGYADGPHDVIFSGGTGTRTVTNSGGGTVNFGTSTSITFANGISTAGGVLQINTAQTASITVTDDGHHTSAPLRIVVSSVVATQISAGGFQTCALRSDGTVECWGSDSSGQLGNGNPLTNSSTPVIVSGLTNVTQIAAGKYHTCALRNDGTVWCWGENVYGQLGNSSTTDSSTPVEVQLTGVTEIDADGQFTCALINDGTVRCWGHDQAGQLGIGSTNNNANRTPQTVVSVGGHGTLGNVTHITVGANHACALISGGTVDCWGLDDHGQLGNGGAIPGTNSASPVQVKGPGGAGYLTGVTEISGGRLHNCALLSDHTVWCWGDNDNGELGDGTKTSRSVPVQVEDITATSISAGEYHSCALLQDGTAQCWGAAAFGQIGDGTTADTSTPVTVIGPGGFGVLDGIASISAGGGDITETDDYEHTCALTTDGTVVCWGQDNYGQLGDGNSGTGVMSVSPVGVALQ